MVVVPQKVADQCKCLLEVKELSAWDSIGTVVWWWLCHYADIPIPIGVRLEVTADNTSVRVSWQWSRQGVPMCVEIVRVHYQPEDGSPIMYTVNNTTVTSATLPNLRCNTEYMIWVIARRGQTTNRSAGFKMFFIPARGMTIHVHRILCALGG